MLYNILIVDDEFLARNTLKTLLPWEKHGFHICGEVNNGKDAIDFIKNEQVNIIITDVCMPVMDGVDLTKYIWNNHPDISIIVMSSYDDFKYVRETLKNGAVDYILKHTISSELILPILKKIKEKISKNQSDILNSELVNQNLQIAEIFSKQQYIKDLILGNESNGDIPDYLSALNCHIETRNVMIAVMKLYNFHFFSVSHSELEIEKMIKNITNISSEVLTKLKESCIIHLNQEKFVLYLPYNGIYSEALIYNLTNDIIQKISSAIKKYFCISTNWGVSPLSSKNFTIHECYKKACLELDKNRFVMQKSNLDEQNSIAKLSLKHEKELLSSIDSMNIEKMYYCIDEIIHSINNDSNYQDTIQIICNEFLTITSKICKEFDLDIKHIYEILNINELFIKSLSEVQLFKKWSKNLFQIIIELLQQKEYNAKYSKYVQLAINYILKNYNQNINLNMIAKEIAISPQYLSKIFKEETGQNLSHFIIQVRIEKAKEALEAGENNLKYLTDKIGFRNTSYFFRTFKKAVGYTPLKYSKTFKKS